VRNPLLPAEMTSTQPRIIDEQPGPVVRPAIPTAVQSSPRQPGHEKVAPLGKIAAFMPDAGPGIEMRSQSRRPDKVLSAGVDRL
jgi:hypothetical protein